MLRELFENTGMQKEQGLQGLKDATSTAWTKLNKMSEDGNFDQNNEFEAIEYAQGILEELEHVAYQYGKIDRNLANLIIEEIEKGYSAESLYAMIDIVGGIGSILNRES